MTLRDLQPRELRASELYGNDWFNGQPVLMSAMRGKVVLVVFWDYTSIRCDHVLPYVAEWHRRYSPLGLVTVGVHTPRFDFGKLPEYVDDAVCSRGLEFPVVMDNDALIWTKYGNREWPGVQIVDGDGFIRYQHMGEGHYTIIEQLIQSMLHDTGVREDFPLLMEPIREEDKAGAVLHRSTEELFAGYIKSSVGNTEGVVPESITNYEDPGIYFDGRIYFKGSWRNERNSARSQDDPADVIVHYKGTDVYAVLSGIDAKDCLIKLQLDGEALSLENKGEDVSIDSKGRSTIHVSKPRRYSIVRSKEYGEHTLRMSFGANGPSLYTLSFVAGVIPELVSS